MSAKLSPKARRVLGAMLEALVLRDAPYEGLPPAETALESVVGYIEAAPAFMISFLNSFILWFNFAAPFYCLLSLRLTWRSFLRMDIESRQWYMGEWDRSPFYFRRSGYLAIRSLVLMGFFNLSEVEKALGYEPACALDGKAPGGREATA